MTREEYEKNISVWTEEKNKLYIEYEINKNKLFMEIFNLEDWSTVDMECENYLSTTRKENIITEWKIFKDEYWIFKIKSINFLWVHKEKPWINRHKWYYIAKEVVIVPITSYKFVDHNFNLS